MLCQFTVGNFRSFYTKRTFTMAAQSLSEGPAGNVFSSGKKKYLKTAAIYGANSSGKSNFVRAFQAMGFTLLDSVRLNPTDSLRFYDPFILNENGPGEPSFFEVVFSSDGKTFRYGFEYNETSIVSEWLFKVLQTKEQVLFIRDAEGISVDETHFAEGVGKEDQTEKNRLFLSLCAQLKGEISKKVIYWFENDIDVLSGMSAWRYEDYTKRLLHGNDVKSVNMRDFYRRLQLGFQKVTTREEKVVAHRGSMDYSSPRLEVDSIHSLYDSDGQVIGTTIRPFTQFESTGTQKVFNLSGPLFDALKKGGTLVIDEMDAAMHPLISQQLILLFNNPETNPRNAQLIFNTHDTHLLSAKILRRDQIWFMEKDSQEQTDLYNMMDIIFPDGTKPRNDSNYEKNYIAGRYGAVPYIQD